MHFQQDTNPALNTISSISSHAIKINGHLYESSVLLTATDSAQERPECTVDDFKPELWQTITDLSPEVVLIGTGAKQFFLSPSVLAPLYAADIGIECMNSNAAARTFNVLASEGRRVLALILLPIES